MIRNGHTFHLALLLLSLMIFVVPGLSQPNWPPKLRAVAAIDPILRGLGPANKLYLRDQHRLRLKQIVSGWTVHHQDRFPDADDGGNKF